MPEREERVAAGEFARLGGRRIVEVTATEVGFGVGELRLVLDDGSVAVVGLELEVSSFGAGMHIAFEDAPGRDAERTRVRTDQPTINTLGETMAAAHAAAIDAFTRAGFEQVQLVVNVVCTSLDPDGDTTVWAAGSRIPEMPDPLLASTLMQSADEAGA